MQKVFSDLIRRMRNIGAGYFMLAFLLAFTLDRGINYFIPFPFFVLFGLAALPILVAQKAFSPPARKWAWILGGIFLAVAIINNMIHGFHPKNISDLLFILLFFIFYLFYSSAPSGITASWVHVLSLIMLVLFSFTFAGVNNIKPVLSDKDNDKYVGPPKQEARGPVMVNDTVAAYVAGDDADVQTARKKRTLIGGAFLRSMANPTIDSLEYYRVYHYGLFRVPQVASYIFGFIGFFYLYFFWRRNRITGILIAALAAFLVLYTGTRIFPLTALVVVAGWLLMKPGRWAYLLIPILLVAVLIRSRYFFIDITDGTFIQQYFTFFATAVDNLPRLSRVILWNSWLTEMAESGPLDLLIGRTFYGSLQANLGNVFIEEWFHNDFFSISYSYGLICAVLYIAFFVKIYRDNNDLIRKNFFVFVLYAAMPVTAFLNGFYYYFPMFTLYIFILIVQTEKHNSLKNENRNTWNPGDPQ